VAVLPYGFSTRSTFFRHQVRSGEAHVSQLAVAASFADLESKGSTEALMMAFVWGENIDHPI